MTNRDVVRLSAGLIWITMVTGMPANAMADGLETLALPQAAWRLVTDGVMGGVSQGTLQPIDADDGSALCLSGNVSTANNGGFIQAGLDLDGELAQRAAAYDGIRLFVRGNGEPYNLHLRTRDLWLPWQSFRHTFDSTDEWREVRLPFASFEAYRTGSRLRVERLRRLGVVAIGRDFAAEICFKDPAFFRVAR